MPLNCTPPWADTLKSPCSYVPKTIVSSTQSAPIGCPDLANQNRCFATHEHFQKRGVGKESDPSAVGGEKWVTRAFSSGNGRPLDRIQLTEIERGATATTFPYKGETLAVWRSAKEYGAPNGLNPVVRKHD